MNTQPLKDKFGKSFTDKYESFELCETVSKKDYDKLKDFLFSVIDETVKECEKEKYMVEQYKTLDEVRSHIRECEGDHKQQVSYSTYHDALTQVCFDCNIVRTNMQLISSTGKRGTE